MDCVQLTRLWSEQLLASVFQSFAVKTQVNTVSIADFVQVYALFQDDEIIH